MLFKILANTKWRKVFNSSKKNIYQFPECGCYIPQRSVVCNFIRMSWKKIHWSQTMDHTFLMFIRILVQSEQVLWHVPSQSQEQSTVHSHVLQSPHHMQTTGGSTKGTLICDVTAWCRWRREVIPSLYWNARELICTTWVLLCNHRFYSVVWKTVRSLSLIPFCRIVLWKGALLRSVFFRVFFGETEARWLTGE